MKLPIIRKSVSAEQKEEIERNKESLVRAAKALTEFLSDLESIGEDCKGHDTNYFKERKLAPTNKRRFRKFSGDYLTALAVLLEYKPVLEWMPNEPTLHGDQLVQMGSDFEVWICSDISPNKKYIQHRLFGDVQNMVLYGPLYRWHNSGKGRWFDGVTALVNPLEFAKVLARRYKPWLTSHL